MERSIIQVIALANWESKGVLKLTLETRLGSDDSCELSSAHDYFPSPTTTVVLRRVIYRRYGTLKYDYTDGSHSDRLWIRIKASITSLHWRQAEDPPSCTFVAFRSHAVGCQ